MAEDICGKTVARVEYDYNDALRLHFTDGTMLYVDGHCHNDDTAGTRVALLPKDAPRSWKESRKFYDHVDAGEWPDA